MIEQRRSPRTLQDIAVIVTGEPDPERIADAIAFLAFRNLDREIAEH